MTLFRVLFNIKNFIVNMVSEKKFDITEKKILKSCILVLISRELESKEFIPNKDKYTISNLRKLVELFIIDNISNIIINNEVYTNDVVTNNLKKNPLFEKLLVLCNNFRIGEY
ncbi:hypothetical protein Anas_03287 [Armadillidium nasatum]|uniref:Uncharacterized protein n=1 Tax=Armadillidium nasatum TaxID=96803 RepID=A0A5N5SIT4_9CRUS|nr:hypothetical protein Anas_03287 [Armadillidium nasatum]